MQLLYAVIGIGSVIINYFIIKVFRPETHQDMYCYIAEYMEIAEFVIILMLLMIGVFVEMGGIKTHAAKNAWNMVTVTFLIMAALESLARIHSMVVLAAHIHPGKIDFMGLFLVMVLMYYILKFCVILAHAMGLHDKIMSIEIKTTQYYYQQVPQPMMPY